ncbi:MAG TPA: phosphoenolpyruvate carboxykinase (ATP), partial [Kiloniellales bacterium]|nr:phosphoenolpyruvate carboxykinase (ATP) [Kiloniellales bacterium]
MNTTMASNAAPEGPVVSRHGLGQQGLKPRNRVYWNLGVAELYEQSLARGEGRLNDGGALCVLTGHHTGRSPNDKFIVEEPASRDNIWWGKVNRAMSQAHFERLHAKVIAYLQGRDLFVQDLAAGADADYRLPIRVVSESAWHALFARNMFLRPDLEALRDHEPEFTVLHAPYLEADPKTDGTNSGSFIVLSFARRLVLIGGTIYAGEIKKSVFSILNYLLPEQRVMPMHCSANVGKDGGDAAIFFGLSGTGK